MNAGRVMSRVKHIATLCSSPTSGVTFRRGIELRHIGTSCQAGLTNVLAVDINWLAKLHKRNIIPAITNWGLTKQAKYKSMSIGLTNTKS